MYFGILCPFEYYKINTEVFYMKNMLKKLNFGILLLSALISFSSCDPTQLFNTDPEIMYIDFDPAPFDYSPYLTVGQQVKMNWYYYTSDGYTHSVSVTGDYSSFTVSSSDPSVCYYSDGYLIAAGAGSVFITITANKGGATTYIDFYVSGRSTSVSDNDSYSNPTYTVSSIYIDTTSTTMVKGDYSYINYDVYPYYANCEVTCKSSNEDVVSASVYYNGCIYVYAKDYGTATVTITSVDNPNVTATCKITVNDGYVPTYTVSSVSLSEEYLFLYINETAYLSDTISPSSAPAEIKWSSSKPEVASVSSGMVTALKAGTAIITATSKDNPSKSASCEVTVSNNKYIKVTGLSFSTNQVTVEQGEDATITVDVQPSGANPKLTWYTSSSSSYFTYTPDETNPTKCKIKGIKEGTSYLYVKVDSDSSIYTYISIKVTKPAAKPANQYFWGTWVRMDNGKKISIEDTQLIDLYLKKSHDITKASTDNEIVIDGSIGDGITSLKYKTQNVMEAMEGDAVIPFYRQGGTNLDYSLKVVGNASLMNRAASGLSGLRVRGTSNKFKTFESKGETSDDGSVTLKAPVQGDVQTVSIELPSTDAEEEAKTVVVENLKIENSGDYMGTVNLAGEDDYILKITGEIDEKDKRNTGGYLYAGNSYKMHLTVTNISSVKAKSSVIKITPNDSSIITLTAINAEDDLEALNVSTLKPGVTLTCDFTVTVNNFTTEEEPVIDTRINIEMINDKSWQDFVPLRVFNEKSSFSIRAGSSKNTSASLNGFLIYPDGNSEFFSVEQSKATTIEVPRFKSTDDYMLVFSGATVEGSLDDSTELFYTVSLSDTPKELHGKVTAEELYDIKQFGEEDGGNETEDDAWMVDSTLQEFEAYIEEGETDFYKIRITN